MKMSTLRDQSAPVLYGLVVLFILAMGGFGNIFSSTNPNRGNTSYMKARAQNEKKRAKGLIGKVQYHTWGGNS